MALSQEELTEIAYQISERFEKVNKVYLSKMAEQVKEIGMLDKDNMHRLQQMAKMGSNIDEINSYLMKQTGLALNDIYRLYDRSAGEIYKDVAYLYTHRGIKQLPISKNVAIQNYINSVKQLTQGTFMNMARTTVISESYRHTIDLAIDTVATGIDDYQTVMRREIIDKAGNGMRVKYASGRTRRLDSACRMNILEGVRQINMGVRKEAGLQYGADGVEIDAHGLCADDHLPYQGRQYSIKQYENINSSLQRPIGTCNCQHGISYIILGISPQTYNKDELEKMKNYSKATVKIGDKEYTRYEASQAMRNAETNMRYKQDEILALKKSGLDYNKQEEQLEKQKKTYYYISKRAGLKARYERAGILKTNKNNITKHKDMHKIENNRKILSEKDKGIILQYKSFDFYAIQETIRKEGFKALSEDEKKKVIQLDEALKKLPNFNGKVTRSLYFYSEEELQSFINDMQNLLDSNGVGIFKSFTSTTYSDEFYNPQAQAQIIINKSTKGKLIDDNLDNGEKEVLYERGFKYKVEKILKKGLAYLVYIQEY